ncbi:hypothetical protein CY34DRAFT_769000 [Suillus luteus UH-Slu-Lm8-n1]|uniref:Uncharacterized protein n=1 Tax=Suillus luteus UH-Slu-Lm8-n1 TaxID=930992 RepID=A0A0C9ZPI7_9AGAM|nr:hypothetical protein CY34DRAFT_769000 [Suillus luteus UH-Slu-Lm8-n1]
MPMAEFLDNIAIDAPKVFDYMAIMLRGAGFHNEPERLRRIASKLEDSNKSILHAAAKWLAVDVGFADVTRINLYIPGPDDAPIFCVVSRFGEYETEMGSKGDPWRDTDIVAHLVFLPPRLIWRHRSTTLQEELKRVGHPGTQLSLSVM